MTPWLRDTVDGSARFHDDECTNLAAYADRTDSGSWLWEAWPGEGLDGAEQGEAPSEAKAREAADRVLRERTGFLP